VPAAVSSTTALAVFHASLRPHRALRTCLAGLRLLALRPESLTRL